MVEVGTIIDDVKMSARIALALRLWQQVIGEIVGITHEDRGTRGVGIVDRATVSDTIEQTV